MSTTFERKTTLIFDREGLQLNEYVTWLEWATERFLTCRSFRQNPRRLLPWRGATTTTVQAGA